MLGVRRAPFWQSIVTMGAASIRKRIRAKLRFAETRSYRLSSVVGVRGPHHPEFIGGCGAEVVRMCIQWLDRFRARHPDWQTECLFKVVGGVILLKPPLNRRNETEVKRHPFTFPVRKGVEYPIFVTHRNHATRCSWLGQVASEGLRKGPQKALRKGLKKGPSERAFRKVPSERCLREAERLA